MEPIERFMDFGGKVVVVTGSALGLGRGVALRFANAGARVAVLDIDDTEAAETVHRCPPGSAFALHCDVGDLGQVETAIQATAERFGRIDILVNNAGIFPTSKLLRASPEHWRQVYATNVDGVFYCTQAAVRQFRSQGPGGVIVNVTSINAFHPSHDGMFAYDSSKGAVTTMTRCLAKELAPYGIRVNALAPGGMLTEGFAAGMANPAMAKRLHEDFEPRIALGRWAEVDEVALPVLFLASDMASYITGETLVVDGGRLLN